VTTPNGRLIVHPERCRGCRSCQLACSFAKTAEYNPTHSCITLERDLRFEKTAPLIQSLCCDFCLGAPACVEACSYDVFEFELAQGSSVVYILEDAS